jgi:hypothetical protein
VLEGFRADSPSAYSAVKSKPKSSNCYEPIASVSARALSRAANDNRAGIISGQVPLLRSEPEKSRRLGLLEKERFELGVRFFVLVTNVQQSIFLSCIIHMRRLRWLLAGRDARLIAAQSSEPDPKASSALLAPRQGVRQRSIVTTVSNHLRQTVVSQTQNGTVSSNRFFSANESQV